MDVVSNNYMPGDPRLIDHIVYELKAQGIFDNFRKECIADVDTKPAYQNLRQRVEGSVVGFLRTKQWKPDMNKNQVREMLRKNISESGFLETGVERIVDQVVNPKINTIFLPQVENVVYKVLGIQKPSAFDELKAELNPKSFRTNERLDMSGNNLLPSDLEAVSPESEPHERKLDVSNESQKLENNRMDEDESPPFEPLEESTSFMVLEDNSVDSHLSGFSGLASHDSNHSFEVTNKITPMEISNQDSQFSKQSSDDHLSIVMSDETETKFEANEDSTLSKTSKMTDSNCKSFDFMHDNQASSDKSSQSSFKHDKSDINKKIEDKRKNDEKKTEKYRSSDKHRPRHDSKSDSRDRKNEKDKKSDRDKKEHRDKSKYGSKDGKDRDKDKKDTKSKSESESKADKDHKHEKDRDRSKNSSSKHSSSKDKSSASKDSAEIIKTKEKPKELDSKDVKTKESECKDLKTKESRTRDAKEKNENSRNRDDSKPRSESKSHSSTKNKGDSKTHSKHNGKSKGGSSDVDKNSSKSNKRDEKSSRKDDKHQSRGEKYSSSGNKDEKRDKDKKDPKKNIKKMSKDDHYGLKGKNSHRRSTDRDSSDGHSGTHSSSSSFAESSTSSQLQKNTQDGSAINSRSNSGDSGTSDHVESVISTETLLVSDIQLNAPETQEEEDVARITPIQHLSQVKLIKPKFASNIFEARRLMKIRKKLGKIEKQSQMGLIKTGVALKNTLVAPAVNEGGSKSILTYEIVTVSDEPDTSNPNDSLKRRPNILKKPLPSKLNSNRGLKGTTAQFYRNKTKSSNHHKKTNEHRKNASGNISAVLERKFESEEENVAEVVEVSDGNVTVSTPLQNSVISKESWDAVEAKLLENVMKDEYHSYANSFECLSDHKEVSVVQTASKNEVASSEDCLGLSQGITSETQRYLEVVHMVMTRLEDNITTKERLLSRPYALKKMLSTNVHDGINRRLPKVAIVDVTSDSEIVISPRKGVKRHAPDHPDVHNNNNKMNTRLEEDQLNEALNHTISKINPSTKPNVPSKAKKAKVVDSSVNHLDTFNLPLSPAESDKSFTTTSDKKNEKDDPRVKRNSNINRAANNSCNQRYSTDDLYKPRLQFSSSRRRAAKNRETN